jgi:hypothetical protein
MYNNPGHKAHAHTYDLYGGSGDPWLYDNGCVLCDAQQVIRDYVSGDYNLPCWLPADEGERAAQDDILTQIRTIKAVHGLPTTGQYRAALAESYGAPQPELV